MYIVYFPLKGKPIGLCAEGNILCFQDSLIYAPVCNGFGYICSVFRFHVGGYKASKISPLGYGRTKRAH